MGQRSRKGSKMDVLEGLDRALAFDRTADRARRLSPSLFPPEITCKKYIYDDGSCEQVYHHRTIGELGRIRIEERGGSAHIAGLVAGDTEDKLHAQREALFRPIMEAFADVDNQLCFQGKHMRCERCGSIAASLIFIDGTETCDFEDCARLMYPEYSRGSAPVWIIGPPVGGGPESPRPSRSARQLFLEARLHARAGNLLDSAPSCAGAADILKVWPTRGPIRRSRPAQFNPLLDRIVDEHCSRKIRPKKRRR